MALQAQVRVLVVLALGIFTCTTSSFSLDADSLDPDEIPNWWTPFHRRQRIDPLSIRGCERVVPGFDPDIVAARDAMLPIRTLDDLRNLQPGQKVLVVAPRFGLGNTLRNWVSAFFWGLWSGRRIVVLHGGKFHGVYTSLCAAFRCSFDHITADTQRASVHMLDEFMKNISYLPIHQTVAHKSLYADDPVVFSYSYAFWDHWWTNNRTLARCACAAIGYCHGGGGFRAAALHALVSGGPSEALKLTVQEVLRSHPANKTDPALPLAEEHRAVLEPGLPVQFDLGLHIRTRVKTLERPGRPFGRCRGRECKDLEGEEDEKMKRTFLAPDMWDCLNAFLLQYASLKFSGRPRSISIFLATDNVKLREEFVRRLTRYGPVYYNGGNVAHVGVSNVGHAGRLPTMAEYFLLGKSHLILELDNYMSTFAQFAATWGNGTLASLPRLGITLEGCTDRQPGQVGIWRQTDPRRVRNKWFKIERQ